MNRTESRPTTEVGDAVRRRAYELPALVRLGHFDARVIAQSCPPGIVCLPINRSLPLWPLDSDVF